MVIVIHGDAETLSSQTPERMHPKKQSESKECLTGHEQREGGADDAA
jgi:hypothetical protein